MDIQVIDGSFSICKAVRKDDVKIKESTFLTVTKEEISVLAKTENIDFETTAREDGYRGFYITGILDFSLIGILARTAEILAAEKISILAESTYNTDYVFVKEENLEKAVNALRRHGYHVANNG